MPRDVIPAPEGIDAPFGVRTELGWSIVGSIDLTEDSDSIGVSHRVLTHHHVPDQLVISMPNNSKEVIDPQMIATMLELEFCETKQVSQAMSQEDIRFMDQVKYGTERTDDGYYVIPLPLKDPSLLLPNNRSQAKQRLVSLSNRLKWNPSLHKEYSCYMEKLLVDGHAERVREDGNTGRVWYIPHHGVSNPNKPKLRVVYDCSFKYGGFALNDNLLKGPDVTNSLIGVLLRFRKNLQCFTNSRCRQTREICLGSCGGKLETSNRK